MMSLSPYRHTMQEKYLKTDKEPRMWSELDCRFMTDESSGGDEGSLHKHPLPWCSMMVTNQHSVMCILQISNDILCTIRWYGELTKSHN